MRHIMTDIETMGTNDDAPIAAIASVQFNPTIVETFQDLLNGASQLYQVIDLTHQEKLGRVFDGSTVLWWMGLPRTTRATLFGSETKLFTAMNEWLDWLGEEDLTMWARGPQFDLKVLQRALEAVGLKIPWKYNSGRDVRTLMEFIPLQVYDIQDAELEEYGFVKHNPLHDCVKQIMQVQRCAAFIRGEYDVMS